MKKIVTGLFIASLALATSAWAGGNEHEASGTVKKVDKAKRTLTISHGPIRSMNMSGMTMDFQVADPAMLSEVKPGDNIKFVLSTDRRGRFVVMDMENTGTFAGN